MRLIKLLDYYSQSVTVWGDHNFLPKANAMSPDDPVCLCFHVSRRKVINFVRIERPQRASQLSGCFGAGTGCGWCRPFLERLWLAEQAGPHDECSEVIAIDDPNRDLTTELTPERYAQLRTQYVLRGGGTPPPGATPIVAD